MLATVPFMVIFRILHILSGVLWVGSAFLFVAFIGPTAGELGPVGGPFMDALVSKRKVAKVITAVALTTVLAGWVLWLRDFHLAGSLYGWITSRFGLVLTIGGSLATFSFVDGFLGVGRNVERMVELGNEIAAGGGPPTPEQAAKMEHLQSDLKKFGMIDLTVLIVAVIAMATARYW